MELREFIKTTLVEIAQGAAEANEELKDLDATVNPHAVFAYGDKQPVDQISARLVKFNVAVTESRGTSGGGKAKANAGALSVFLGISAEIGAEASKNIENLSRIEFEIPLALPMGEKRESNSVIK